MSEIKIKCTLTDCQSGKTVNINSLTEEERLIFAEKMALRAFQTLYGPNYEMKIEKQKV